MKDNGTMLLLLMLGLVLGVLWFRDNGLPSGENENRVGVGQPADVLDTLNCSATGPVSLAQPSLNYWVGGQILYLDVEFSGDTIPCAVVVSSNIALDNPVGALKPIVRSDHKEQRMRIRLADLMGGQRLLWLESKVTFEFSDETVTRKISKVISNTAGQFAQGTSKSEFAFPKFWRVGSELVMHWCPSHWSPDFIEASVIIRGASLEALENAGGVVERVGFSFNKSAFVKPGFEREYRWNFGPEMGFILFRVKARDRFGKVLDDENSDLISDRELEFSPPLHC